MSSVTAAGCAALGKPCVHSVPTSPSSSASPPGALASTTRQPSVLSTSLVRSAGGHRHRRHAAEQREFADRRAGRGIEDHQAHAARGDRRRQAHHALRPDAVFFGQPLPGAADLRLHGKAGDAHPQRQVFGEADQVEPRARRQIRRQRGRGDAIGRGQ
jgi:hypothetical protein